MPNDLVEPSTGRKAKIRRGKYGPLKKRTIKEGRLFSAKRRSKARVGAIKNNSGDHTRTD
jgi:hypothetical protein